MEAYHMFMAEQIAEEIAAINDPLILSIYLKAILNQRCKIGGAQRGTCKGCRFQGHYCRELYNINVDEIKRFGGEL